MSNLSLKRKREEDEDDFSYYRRLNFCDQFEYRFRDMDSLELQIDRVIDKNPWVPQPGQYAPPEAKKEVIQLLMLKCDIAKELKNLELIEYEMF